MRADERRLTVAISEKFRAAVRDQRRILDAYLGNLDRAREHLCKLAKWHEEMCFAGADSTEFMDFYRVMDDAAVLVSRIPQKSGLWSATPPYVPLWRARNGLNIAYEQARILNNCIDLLENASRDFCALARRHAAWTVGLDGENLDGLADFEEEIASAAIQTIEHIPEWALSLPQPAPGRRGKQVR